MRAGQVAFIALLLIGQIGIANSAPAGKPVDPATLDLGGVKLYMTGQEVIAALQSKFGPSIPVVDTTNGLAGDGQIGFANGDSRYHPGTKVIREIGYSTETGKYVINLIEANDKPEAVYMVQFFRQVGTDADEKQFYQTVVGKYGPPTSRDYPTAWCTRSGLTGVYCDQAKAAILSMGGMPGGVSTLTLWDIPFQLRLENAQKNVTTQKKPVF